MRVILLTYIDPAVYYAHLASNRARCHEDKGYNEQMLEEAGQKSSSDDKNKAETEVKPLLEFHAGPDHNEFGMWYI